MAYLASRVMRRVLSWLGRFAGPQFIITVSGSCGFVLGVAAASGSAIP
ncbi:MAG: hypothetical protein JF597_37030 [Streptomyces sp.]|nr:hypothetical protein [Streptomyces sp.]MBW8798976.1 hypothetical protein [Streptomyces sp.]